MPCPARNAGRRGLTISYTAVRKQVMSTQNTTPEQIPEPLTEGEELLEQWLILQRNRKWQEAASLMLLHAGNPDFLEGVKTHLWLRREFLKLEGAPSEPKPDVVFDSALGGALAELALLLENEKSDSPVVQDCLKRNQQVGEFSELARVVISLTNLGKSQIVHHQRQ